MEVALDAAVPERSLTLQAGHSTWLLHDLRAPDGFAAALAVEQIGGES
jgi:hypothetical protein